jgi:hypothetical protein
MNYNDTLRIEDDDGAEWGHDALICQSCAAIRDHGLSDIHRRDRPDLRRAAAVDRVLKDARPTTSVALSGIMLEGLRGTNFSGRRCLQIRATSMRASTAAATGRRGADQDLLRHPVANGSVGEGVVGIDDAYCRMVAIPHFYNGFYVYRHRHS